MRPIDLPADFVGPENIQFSPIATACGVISGRRGAYNGCDIDLGPTAIIEGGDAGGAGLLKQIEGIEIAQLGCDNGRIVTRSFPARISAHRSGAAQRHFIVAVEIGIGFLTAGQSIDRPLIIKNLFAAGIDADNTKATGGFRVLCIACPRGGIIKGQIANGRGDRIGVAGTCA